MVGQDLYGRSEAEWTQLELEGLRFLIEQARLQRTTTYTELNEVLHRRTGLRRFDFSLDSERAAMCHLLYRNVECDRPESGLMVSALVVYLDANDAGSGFYKLAQQYGELPASASADEKLVFWTDQVRKPHERHRRGLRSASR